MGDEAVPYRGAALPPKCPQPSIPPPQSPCFRKRSPPNGCVPCTLRLCLLSGVFEIVGDGILRTLMPYHSRLLPQTGTLAVCLRLCRSEVSRPVLQECNQHLTSLAQFAIIPLTSGAGPAEHHHVGYPCTVDRRKSKYLAYCAMRATQTVRSPHKRSHAALPHDVQGTGAVAAWC